MNKEKPQKGSEAKTAVKKQAGAKQADRAKESSQQAIEGKKLAAILLRGLINVKKDIVATLFVLRLRNKHICVVIEDNPSNRASLEKCKDYITYGEVSDDIYNELIAKRGKNDAEGKARKFFQLNSPKGGFEKKGIKNAFTNGGALGYRKDKINDLIKRML